MDFKYIIGNKEEFDRLETAVKKLGNNLDISGVGHLYVSQLRNSETTFIQPGPCSKIDRIDRIDDAPDSYRVRREDEGKSTHFSLGDQPYMISYKALNWIYFLFSFLFFLKLINFIVVSYKLK